MARLTQTDSLPDDFSLGEWLKNVDTPTPSHCGPIANRQTRKVDSFVMSEFWQLDLEYYLSCSVSMMWSIVGLFQLGQLVSPSCHGENSCLFIVSTILFTLNLLELLSIGALIYAKTASEFAHKVFILKSVIGTKFFLLGVNFLTNLWSCFTYTCGRTPVYHHEHELDGSILEGFLLYDTRFLGLAHAFASVGLAISGALLSVKRNDIKMYILYRLGTLDKYIQDLQSRN